MCEDGASRVARRVRLTPLLVSYSSLSLTQLLVPLADSNSRLPLACLSLALCLQAPELRGLSYLAMFRAIAEEAGRRGILVLMACHRTKPDAWPGDGLWFDADVSEHQVSISWEKITQARCGLRTRRWRAAHVGTHICC